MFAKPIITPPICSECQTEMRLVPAGVSRKTGKEYSAFWSCPNNLKGCGGKTIKYTEPAPKAPQKPYYKPTEADIPVVKESSDNGIIQLITNLASRIDMAVENLGRIETRFNELNDKLDGLKADLGLIINEIIPKVE